MKRAPSRSPQSSSSLSVSPHELRRKSEHSLAHRRGQWPHRLSCYGQKAVSTPNIDRLAREGVRYTRAYTTAPVCSPSRSAFMTGMYQTTIGAQNHRSHRDDGYTLPAGVRVLTEWMRDAGYFTANVVEMPPGFGFKGHGQNRLEFHAAEQAVRFQSVERPRSRTSPSSRRSISRKRTASFTPRPKADPAKVEIPPYYPDHPVTRADCAQYLDAAMELDRKVGLILAQLEKRRAGGQHGRRVFRRQRRGARAREAVLLRGGAAHSRCIIRWPKECPGTGADSSRARWMTA